MSVLVKFLVIPMPHVPTRQAATHVSVPWAFLEMAQHVKVSETIAKIKVCECYSIIIIMRYGIGMFYS